MLEYGKDTGAPETYRIILAVSVALLVHTLLMATFPFELPEHRHNPVTVSVQLMPEGSRPSTHNTPAPTSSPVLATPFTIEPQPVQPARDVSTTSSPQPLAVPRPAPEKMQSAGTRHLFKAQRKPEPEAQTSTSSGAGASAPNVAGQQSARRDDTEQKLTLRSEKPSEESTYLSLLVQTIARKATIPKLDDFEKGQVLRVELELTLMSNGTLVGARITEASGNDGLDQRVYRAALAASPYPEPPTSSSRQQRFRVEVRYTF